MIDFDLGEISVAVKSGGRLKPNEIPEAQRLVNLCLAESVKYTRFDFKPDSEWRYTWPQVFLAAQTVYAAGAMGKRMTNALGQFLDDYHQEHSSLAGPEFKDRLARKGMLKPEFELHDWRLARDFFAKTELISLRSQIEEGDFLLVYRFPKPLQAYDWKFREGKHWPERLADDTARESWDDEEWARERRIVNDMGGRDQINHMVIE